MRLKSGRTARLLMVEDNPADAELMSIALKDLKIRLDLTHAWDGAEALQMLRDPGAKRPDLILLDLNLPVMDGRSTLAALKKDDDLCGIPVVIMTTSDAPDDITASYKLQASCYVTKPLDFDDFRKIVGELGNFWFEIVKLP